MHKVRYENMNQKQRVLEWLKRHKGITPLEAWVELGIYRLSDVIWKLRKYYIIDTEEKVIINKFGEECRVAFYVLMGKKDS